MNKKMWMLSSLLAVAVFHAGPGFSQDEQKQVSMAGSANENLIKNGTFDSEKKPAIRKKDKDNRFYMIGKHWGTLALVWSKDTELCKKIYPLMRISVEKDSTERKNVIVIENQAAITRHLDSEGKPMLAVYLSQTVPLASSEKQETYRFSMKAKGSFGERSITRTVMLICNFRDGTGKDAISTGKSLLHRFAVKQGQWQDLNVKVTVPPGTKSCSIKVALYGVGKFSFDDIRFEKTE